MAGRRQVNPILMHYATALVLVLMALGLGLLLEPFIGYRSPLILFIAAALIAGWCGGMGPGLLAMLTGFLAGDFFFVPPLHRFGEYTGSDAALLLTYSMVTIIGLAAVSSLRQARQHEEEVKKWNKELEQRVRERTAELEAFSYSISHDLRAPIRAIASFAQLLKEDYASRLDEEGLDMLSIVIQSATNMDRLLNDLLKLYRISRTELHRESVDLSALAQSIAQTLQKNEPQRVVVFNIAPGLIAQGDEGLLRIALENLLHNAWKFTVTCPKGQITFASEPFNGQRAYCVRDNGIGFEMKNAVRLFGVFERLQPGGDFPGTGIGLAIVQRIITRHGGQIWATATRNQGAAFYFTLAGDSGTTKSIAQ